MLEFLAAWGAEIILGLIATAITGWFTYKNKQLKAQLDKANAYDEAEEKKTINQMIDKKLKPLKEEHKEMDNNMDEKIQPIYKELENLRAYERLTRVESDELRRVLLDSWCYRIKELCEAHLSHGKITVGQLRQLQEFFGFYTSLGGNGIAADLYAKVTKLPMDLEGKE